MFGTRFSPRPMRTARSSSTPRASPSSAARPLSPGSPARILRISDAYADFRKHPEDYKAGTTKAKTIADFNGAKVEEIFDEVDGAYYPLADEQASDAYLGRGAADAIAATAAFLKEQKKVDALLPNYSGTITAEFVKAVAPPSQ